MNPEQLWETTLDPSLRVLREVTIAEVEDIEQDTKERNLFEDLMGDQETTITSVETNIPSQILRPILGMAPAFCTTYILRPSSLMSKVTRM